MLRTHDAGSLRATDAGQIVSLAGWVARRRDHGGVAFIDLRDATGSVQVVIRDEVLAGSLRAEWCLAITGEVVARPSGNENLTLPTGAIEVMGDAITVLSESAPLPFPVDTGVESEISEEVRLRYRYLDLRREGPAANLRLRSKVTAAIRGAMQDLDFLESTERILLFFQNQLPRVTRLLCFHQKQNEFHLALCLEKGITA